MFKSIKKTFLNLSSSWSSYFPIRDLQVFAVYPTIISPTHYTNEKGHVSDTEGTSILDANKFELKTGPHIEL